MHLHGAQTLLHTTKQSVTTSGKTSKAGCIIVAEPCADRTLWQDNMLIAAKVQTSCILPCCVRKVTASHSSSTQSLTNSYFCHEWLVSGLGVGVITPRPRKIVPGMVYPRARGVLSVVVVAPGGASTAAVAEIALLYNLGQPERRQTASQPGGI